MKRKIAVKCGHAEKLHIALCHYKQRYNWDCGISCILMILPRKHRLHLLQNFSEICKHEGFNKSTWTIDLCYLLRRYDVKHEFFTITMGVHPGYKSNTFYGRVLSKDEARVNKKFKEAQSNGIKISLASTSASILIEHLSNGPAIVLTNAHLLTCDLCKLNKLSNELRKCLPWPTVYQGHYIVLCGYDINKRRVFYRNPSLSDRVCVMPFENFEEARRDYGTDEDVILIYT